jgi:hypothetical protein
MIFMVERQDIVFSLILGRTDLRGKFFLRKSASGGLKQLKCYVLSSIYTEYTALL